MNIGDTIKSERKKKNLTQKQLAEKINKSERMIQKYENGEVIPSIEVLNKIGAALGVFIFKFENTDSNQSIEQLQSDYFEQYIKSIGYELEGDLSEGYLFIKTTEGTYEITMKDLEEIKISSRSFIEYTLNEIIKKSRKIGK